MSGEDRFVEIFVNTPLEVCEARDIKGLYAMARRGEIKGFTGIDDPYEEPVNAEITLNTVDNTPEELARQIISYLQKQDFIN
jgi:sulfate adenylyltransferase